MKIYCCGCRKEVNARLTNGGEIYPHRKDLITLPFWKCDTCKNRVGCHHKTKNRTRPLGCIPTKEIIEKRKVLHELIDPIWMSGKIERKRLYSMISSELGFTYHTGEIKSVEECERVIEIVENISLK